MERADARFTQRPHAALARHAGERRDRPLGEPRVVDRDGIAAVDVHVRLRAAGGRDHLGDALHVRVDLVTLALVDGALAGLLADVRRKVAEEKARRGIERLAQPGE